MLPASFCTPDLTALLLLWLPCGAAASARYANTSNAIIGAGVVECDEGSVLEGCSEAIAYRAKIRQPGYVGRDPVVFWGSRLKEDMPVALRVAVLWLKHSLPEVWTRMRCPGPLITQAYGGELPPMSVEALPVSHGKRGMSMALGLALAMVSCLTGCAVRKRVGVTGSMDISGRLWGVGQVQSKARGMKEVGVKTVVIPVRCDQTDNVAGVTYEVCRHIFEALPLVLEPHAHQGPPPGTEARGDGLLVDGGCVGAD